MVNIYLFIELLHTANAVTTVDTLKALADAELQIRQCRRLVRGEDRGAARLRRLARRRHAPSSPRSPRSTAWCRPTSSPWSAPPRSETRVTLQPSCLRRPKARLEARQRSYAPSETAACRGLLRVRPFRMMPFKNMQLVMPGLDPWHPCRFVQRTKRQWNRIAGPSPAEAMPNDEWPRGVGPA